MFLPSISMTHVVCESNLRLVARSSIHPGPGNVVAIGRIHLNADSQIDYTTHVENGHICTNRINNIEFLFTYDLYYLYFDVFFISS